jgi:putative iron-dependent peroxidase
MLPFQPGILAPIPAFARYLAFELVEPAHAAVALQALQALADGEKLVVGLGMNLVQVLESRIPGLRVFPALSGPGVAIPSTPAALWCWLRSDEADPGSLLQQTLTLEAVLTPAFQLQEITAAFRHGEGRDLTGFEDGTENPQGDEAITTAFFSGEGEGFDGSSLVAVQRWQHDMGAFNRMDSDTQDNMIGRRRSDNEELDEAPASAHVKRTAQESFSPEAFVLRRSMPWLAGATGGLLFTAFARSFDAFEAQLTRMAGLEDGITDALFRFTRPLTGAYYWCPPIKAGRLDLRALGL